MWRLAFSAEKFSRSLCPNPAIVSWPVVVLRESVVAE
jgi:hypothetical protein